MEQKMVKAQIFVGVYSQHTLSNYFKNILVYFCIKIIFLKLLKFLMLFVLKLYYIILYFCIKILYSL